jgi:hypothetical protein
MAKPGRISSAALAVGPIVDGHPPKLTPPRCLSEAERIIFDNIVNSCARAHFRPSDAPLLNSYCRAISLERRAAAALARDPFDSKALLLWEKSSRAMVAIAAKPRLCPSARQHPRSTARMPPHSGPRPWT